MSYYGKDLPEQWPIDFTRSNRVERIKAKWYFDADADFLGTATFAQVINGTALKAKYADLAERYEINTPHFHKGMIVSIGGEKEIKLADKTSGDTPFGIISSDPCLMMNSEAGDDNTHPYICMIGRAPCDVIGKVKKGDVIILSNIEGVGISSNNITEDNRKYIIGKSLKNKDTEEISQIEIVSMISIG